MNSCIGEILYFVSLLKICLIACASSLILPWQQQRNSYTEPRQYQNRYVNVNIFFYIQLRYKYGYKYLKVIKYQQVDVNDDCRNPLTVTRTTLDTCHVVIVHSCSMTCIHVPCFLQSLSTQFLFFFYIFVYFNSTCHVSFVSLHVCAMFLTIIPAANADFLPNFFKINCHIGIDAIEETLSKKEEKN